MNKLQTLLSTVHQAILDYDSTEAVPALKINPRLTPEQQLAIYMDGYRLRLIEAIRSDYPALLAYLGDNVFDQRAAEYIQSTPPHHYNLDRYPHAFAPFVAQHCGDDFAADLAQLEGAIARVFMLGESTELSAEALAGITPESLADLVLTPRTASCILALRYPADTYMEALREGSTPEKPATQPRALYLVRHHNEVKRHELSPAEYSILSRLAEGMPFGQALESVVEAQPELMADMPDILQSGFARWVSNGFFQTITE